ncbi:MAG: TolC family protein, partial [Panacagrimonas sp.]
SHDQAELKTSLARFELEQAEDNLLLETVGAYLGVLSAQDIEQLTRAELEAVERQSAQVRGRGQAGMALESDVLAADAHRSTAAAELIAVQGKLEAAYAALDLVAGQPFRLLRTLPEGMVVTRPEPANAQAWAEKAREQHLAVVQARLNTRIAALEAEKTRATRMPKVQVVGSAGYLDLSGGISGERSERDARIGVDLSVPIYAGGSIAAGIEAADASAQRAELLLQAARAKAEHDARVAYTNMVSSYSRVPAQREAVMAARAAEASVEGGFDAGTRTSADVLRAVEERYDAEKAYSAARYGHMLDGLRLKMAAGILVNSDLHQLDRLLRASPDHP